MQIPPRIASISIFIGRLPRHVLLLLAFASGAIALPAQENLEILPVDTRATASPLPHFWETMFGSGRAILSLREAYRKDLSEVHNQVGMRYVRFHAILHDEAGVYDEDQNGNAVYNFSYVDQIYDGLLERGVRPFVEISFMPRKLAAKDAPHPFWYKQNVSPPKDYAKWDALMRAFASHLVDRYGIDEVSQWYFEVWNEPNIDFWAGDPKQKTYFELYDHTARALKEVNSRLRVGGPSTAIADWIPQFLQHTAQNHVPVDFVSSHAYADDTVEDLFGTHDEIPMRDRVCRAIQKVSNEIKTSSSPALPLIWSEWNVASFDQLNARDTIYVPVALAKNIHDCDGYVNTMSFWTFDDVFEEGGVVKEPFHGGFGLIAAGGIKKPSFYGFALLHQLGEERLANKANDSLVTRRKDGTLVIAIWNLVDLDQAASGKEKTVRLQFSGQGLLSATIRRVDADHGNPMTAYRAMGSPRYPTRKQIDALNAASALPPPELRQITNNSLDVRLPVNGVAVIEVSTRAKNK
jgi:xylan 1,4-beta-xylosidase